MALLAFAPVDAGSGMVRDDGVILAKSVLF